MLHRILESEVMNSAAEASDYDTLDHREVNRQFSADLLATGPDVSNTLDLGTGTAQIPIQLCRMSPLARVVAVDAADAMLQLATRNVHAAGLTDRIALQRIDAKRLPFVECGFTTVMSNSIVHHIPTPLEVVREAVRVCAPQGTLFFRDLLRPPDSATLERLVAQHAGNANEHQRQMFHNSLQAALSLEEICGLVESLGFPAQTVQISSDRHWTWCTRKSDSC
jgi:ubiquinone/menaquinone biosynthesis C-methylase UbiE